MTEQVRLNNANKLNHLLTIAKLQVKIKLAEGIAQSVSNQLENVMTPKEVKAALADEGVQAAIEKQVAAAVKAETKRCIEVVKAAEIPENGGKEIKVFVKAIVAGIKG
jgi:hypothetical protein